MGHSVGVSANSEPTSLTPQQPTTSQAGDQRAERRPFALREAIQLALQNSNVIRTLAGDTVVSAPTTAYAPGIASQLVVVEEAEFDPTVEINASGRRYDEPTDTADPLRQSRGLVRDESDFVAKLAKRWTPGTVTSLSYEPPLGYLYRRDPSLNSFNPRIGAAVVAEARQPLLRGAGSEVNTAPIHIAQLQADQSAWDVKGEILAELRSIEETYWRLQAARVSADALDRMLPLLDEAVRIEKLLLQAERVTAAEVARVQLQRREFLQQRIRAGANIRESENLLRTLVGLPLNDGQQLIPVDQPDERYQPPTHDECLSLALSNRPDVLQRRLQVRVREIENDLARNQQRPQFDLTALYRLSGISDEYQDAFDQIGQAQYASWSAGFLFSVPLGNRAAKARRLAAEQQLAQERALLQQQVQNVSTELANILNDMAATWAEYEQSTKQVSEGEDWVQTARLRFNSPPPAGEQGGWLIVALNDYQLALRSNIEALTNSAQLLARYNALLARLHEAQGTLLDRRLVQLDRDPVVETQTHLNEWLHKPSPIGHSQPENSGPSSNLHADTPHHNGLQPTQAWSDSYR
ncbi:TolC family protein [Thalassoroseus pseudoceratinae]|uniref:TolC family protein n=1 Tax=Thalassoroseus pseudoceratinae TaxID=2713176 RepID=UPI001422598E|nr:TolC family protein [Thalassoroseus pseudoceratinae]